MRNRLNGNHKKRLAVRRPESQGERQRPNEPSATSVNRKGSLTVVGLGIQCFVHLTPAARASIEGADKVLALASDLVSFAWLRELNRATESLNTLYKLGENRLTIYRAMVNRIMECVKNGLNVCVVSYGHPGYLVNATHAAIRLAREHGYKAEMQPAISSADCLLADLEIDPGDAGCQIYEATNFLIRKRRIDTTCPMILLQVGVAGDLTHKQRYSTKPLTTITALLESHYGADHQVIIYEAAQYPFARPRIESLRLRRLPRARLSTFSTLYVPPKRTARINGVMLERLGFRQRKASARTY